ncbi:MAG: TonB-dependent receptor [Acidobacteriota bacterium]|jgi:hypothetical protein
MRRAPLLAGLAILWVTVTAAAAPEAYQGLPLADALHRLQEMGLRVVFSTDLVRPEMRVAEEPEASWPEDVLGELLAPHGLEARRDPAGLLLVVPAPPRGRIVGVVEEDGGAPIPGATIRIVEADLRAVADAAGTFRTGLLPAGSYTLEATHDGFLPTTLAQIRVADRRDTRVSIALSSRRAGSARVRVEATDPASRPSGPARVRVLDPEAIRGQPGAGADPLRALARDPAVVQDETAAPRVRGGEDDEVQVILDGLELYEPFHGKEQWNLFSIVDAESVGGMDFYAGNFPAAYGGRMSGVVEIASADPEGPPRTEIGVQTERLRVASSGIFDDGHGSWLLAARRGDPSDTLEALGADPAYQPTYYDLFGKVGYDLGERSTLSVQFLGTRDAIQTPDAEDLGASQWLLPLEAASDDRYAWVRWGQTWTPRLHSWTTLSHGSLGRERHGLSGDGRFDDERATRLSGLRQDWGWAGARQTWQWGLDVRSLQATYRYVSSWALPAAEAERGGLREADPAGIETGLYVSDEIRISGRVRTELGLRWDRQTYTEAKEAYWSPRAAWIVDLGPATHLRMAWGRFSQPQRIDELQVEDGIVEFQPVQHAEHRSMDLEHRFPGGHAVEVSVYQKLVDNPVTRFENLWDPFEFFPEAREDRVRIDAGAAAARGLEIGYSSPGAAPVSGWVTYTLASAEDVVDGEAVPRAWDQRHRIRFGVTCRFREFWQVGVSGTYATGIPTTEVVVDGTGEAALGPRNGARLPPFHRVDVGVSRVLILRRMQLRFFANLLNVYDRDNAIPAHEIIREPDGTTSVRTVERFGMPRFLSFGVNWAF